jgi:alpha-glucoside transport system substrate-binding protein
MNKKVPRLLAALLAAALILDACTGGQQASTPIAATATTNAAARPQAAVAPTGPIDCQGAKQGDTITMIYQWSGTEEQNLMRILKPLVDVCGIKIEPTSSRDQGLLDTRVKSGTPPDITFYNVVQLQQYQDQLVPVDQLGVDPQYYTIWKSLGTFNGKWVGLPVKTDIKTIVWYSPTNFQALGYNVPKTWDDLKSLVDKMAADGNVPWSMGIQSSGSTGWPGADFIEDILLATQGPDYVNKLITGQVPFNDAAVKDAFMTYGTWVKDAKYAVGGTQGTLKTHFLDSIYKPFTDPPQAMMVKISGFAEGAIQAKFPNLKYGTDFDFFVFPDSKGMQIGSDWMMAFHNTPAVKAVFAYLGSPRGAQEWAKVGFDISPNSAAAGAYTDPGLEKKAELLYASKAVVPSTGDAIPGGFGPDEWQGIVDYINGGDLNSILDKLASAQKSALGK